MYNNHTMQPTKSKKTISFPAIQVAIILSLLLCVIAILLAAIIYYFEKQYAGKVYPNVYIGNMAVSGQTKADIEKYWESKNIPFSDIQIELYSDEQVATISGKELNLGYDAALSAQQAYLIGRSGLFLSDLYAKYFKHRTELTPYFRWNSQILEDAIDGIAQTVDVPVQDALFEYQNGRVQSFKPSKDGKRLDRELVKADFAKLVTQITASEKSGIYRLQLQSNIVKPAVSTANANSLGIKELIGRGYSQFGGSIPGRIHNVALAASKLHGLLIAPGEKFSFNTAVGDISASTGYQAAYIIKDGRTVLGDGGGVCQVSSTLFRAALNTGLPIEERHAHAYRVHYYEDGGFKAGLDATVFSPSVDLQFRNDTPGYILIQTKADTKKLTLEIDFYGTTDGRKAEIYNHVVSGVTSPPPPLYQDDPTLPSGVVKQVDFAAWGARASFQYRVTRNTEVLQDTTFFSSYRPWQAVYLKGTKS